MNQFNLNMRHMYINISIIIKSVQVEPWLINNLNVKKRKQEKLDFFLLFYYLFYYYF